MARIGLIGTDVVPVTGSAGPEGSALRPESAAPLRCAAFVRRGCGSFTG